jgi:hypothetical protein
MNSALTIHGMAIVIPAGRRVNPHRATRSIALATDAGCASIERWLGCGDRHRDGSAEGVADQHGPAETETAVESLDEPGPVGERGLTRLTRVRGAVGEPAAAPAAGSPDRYRGRS